MADDRVEQLETMLKAFLQPVKNQPFGLIIKALTGHEVLPFDLSNPETRSLLAALQEAAEVATKTAHHQGIFAGRPNEAGNAVEPFVLNALQSAGLDAQKPKNKRGRVQTTGYPDLQIEFGKSRMCYLECKTYSSKSRDSSNRSFFLSPSENPKVNASAHHLIIAFELERAPHRDRGPTLTFVPIRWHIYTLENLRVDLKYEFNASNKRLYDAGALLAEGEFIQNLP